MRRLYAAGMAATFVLGIGACSPEEPKPSFADPTSSSTPTDDRSPTPSATSVAQAMQMWVAGFNRLERSGKADDVEAVSSRGCASCSNYIDPFVAFAANGGKIEGGEWSVVRTTKTTKRYVEVIIEMAGGTNQKSSGEPALPFPAKTEKLRFAAKEFDSSYLVVEILTIAK